MDEQNRSLQFQARFQEALQRTERVWALHGQTPPVRPTVGEYGRRMAEFSRQVGLAEDASSRLGSAEAVVLRLNRGRVSATAVATAEKAVEEYLQWLQTEFPEAFLPECEAGADRPAPRCERCGSPGPTVHLTWIMPDSVQRRDFCEQCYRSGEGMPAGLPGPGPV